MKTLEGLPPGGFPIPDPFCVCLGRYTLFPNGLIVSGSGVTWNRFRFASERYRTRSVMFFLISENRFDSRWRGWCSFVVGVRLFCIFNGTYFAANAVALHLVVFIRLGKVGRDSLPQHCNRIYSSPVNLVII